MIRAELSEAAARLPELLALALGGEEVLLTEDARDVLRLSSVEGTANEGGAELGSHEGLSDLEVIRRETPLTRERMLVLGITPAREPNVGPLPPPLEGGGGSLLETLLRMRAEEYD